MSEYPTLTVDGDPWDWTGDDIFDPSRNTVRIDGDLPTVTDIEAGGGVDVFGLVRALRVGDKVTLAHCDTKTTEEVDRWAEASYANPSIVTPPEMGYRPNDDGSWTCRHPYLFATGTVAKVEKHIEMTGSFALVTVSDVEAL